MIKRGWLSDTDASMLEAQVARFFGVSNLVDVPHLDHAAKKSDYESIPPEQLAWLFRVRQIAKKIKVPAYSEKKLFASLDTLELLLPFRDEISTVPEIMTECGVRFVVVETLPGSKIDGACFWLDNSPVIGISTRHDRIDNFWFVLRHEIEHVLRGHGKQLEIVDADTMESQARGSIIAEEQVANGAAANFCVPKKDLDSFIARKSPFFSERDILGFAKVKERHPGIVIGQIHARTERYELLRKYLVKIRAVLLQKSVFDGWGTIYPVTL
jgi:HTH-type transcriptional regulator/antitoxin HigA